MNANIDYTKQILSVAQNINVVGMELARLKDQHAALRTLILQRVGVTKVGETITLQFGKRKIKAKRNDNGRYKVTEGNRILDSDYLHGITELRFEIAMRAI
jgi:hypothetical protein